MVGKEMIQLPSRLSDNGKALIVWIWALEQIKTILIKIFRLLLNARLLHQKRKLPNKTYQDTITCRIIGDDGRLVGKRGITNSEITHHVCSFVLERNDSLNIAVRHIMSKEQLQGISDVGIRLIRTDKAIKQRIF